MNSNLVEPQTIDCVQPDARTTKHIPLLRPRVLTNLNRAIANNLITKSDGRFQPPSMYAFNSNSIAKPHAIQLLSAEVATTNPGIVIVTESKLMSTHVDQQFNIPGYSLFRRDRNQLTKRGKERRGGGVAIYVKTRFQACVFKPSCDTDKRIELIWVRLQKDSKVVYVGGVYHPPTPVYAEEQLLTLLQQSLEEIESTDQDSLVILTGDFNQFPDSYIQELGLLREVIAPTRGKNYLDRLYTSEPMYSSVAVVAAPVKTDHKAIYARCDDDQQTSNGTRTTCLYRTCTPAQHANYLNHMKNCPSYFDFNLTVDESNVQQTFDNFYLKTNQILDDFYPERSITLRSRDPSYITPHIKQMLRRKNKLMRQGRIEAADSMAKKIQTKIIAKNSTNFSKQNPIRDSKDLWTRVRAVTGKGAHKISRSEGFTAEQLNAHYAGISTDTHYVVPAKREADRLHSFQFTEEQIFKILDKLKPTSPGLDRIPSWFLRISAPILAAPLTVLYNISMRMSVVPKQWKCSVITPVAKVIKPLGCADFRPISITPILSRSLEKLVVQNCLYPVLVDPEFTKLFKNQFAFRPTGSTTAALIALTHTIAELLVDHPFVHVIALDFSKAFDTVRHSTLLEKCSNLPIGYGVHDWLVSYLDGREHRTKLNGYVSDSLSINASVVQGSGIGPMAYVITASDFCPLHQETRPFMYADDCYLVITSANSSHVRDEIDHVAIWAARNNLKLNKSKTQELIVRKRGCRKALDVPDALDGVTRVETLKVLGVLLQSSLSFEEHIKHLVNQCAQTVYALRTLRSHGLSGHPLWQVTQSTLVAKATYASQAWWGMLDAGSRQHLEAVISKAIKQGYLPSDHRGLAVICDEADNKLLSAILKNPHHVLHQFLPPKKITKYNLRSRAHNRIIPTVTDDLFRKTFIIRMIYKDSF